MLSENADFPKNSYKSFRSSYLKSFGCVLDVERMLCAQRVLLCAFTDHETPSLPLQILVIPAITMSKGARTRANVRALCAGTVYEHDRSCIARSPSPRFTVAGALVHPFQDTPFSLCKSRCGSPQNLRLLSRASTVNTEYRSEYRISRIDNLHKCSLGKIINRFFFDKVTSLLCFR